MKLFLFAYFVMLLQLAVTNPVDVQHESLVYDKHQIHHLWEKSGKFQGDIILSAEQAKDLFSANTERNGRVKTKYRWPNKVIPYVLSDDFTASEKSFIENSLKEDYARTCITIEPRKNQTDFVYVTGLDEGCSSWIGRQGGMQILNLQRNGCLIFDTIVHEFLHAAGFAHQHSDSERDDYVEILWENIIEKEKSNFIKYANTTVTSFGEAYDYGSVMHYDPYAFSIDEDNKKTIVPLQNVEIGTAKKLSDIDIRKLNKMYDC